MGAFYATYITLLDHILYELYSLFYLIIENFIFFGFRYCPFYYQMMYFYFPILYLILRRRAKASGFNTYFDKSSLNWLFFQFKKVSNVVILFSNISIFFQKLFISIKVIVLQAWFPVVTAYYTLFKKNTKSLWRPIFKKLSYFGVFAHIRTKWFKKN